MQPLVSGVADALDERGFRWLQTVGRLDQSTSLAEAQRELQAIGRRLAGMYQENGEYQAYVKPLDTGVARRLAALFTVLLGMTGLVSLIVCSNVANLLMLRGSTRASELGIRLSLGASRGRLALQLFLESTILAALGTAVGLVVARWGQDLLPAMMPASTLPLSLQGKWSVAMALFGVAFGLGMMVLFVDAQSF